MKWKEKGIRPGVQEFTSLMSVFAASGNPDGAFQILERMKKGSH